MVHVGGVARLFNWRRPKLNEGYRLASPVVWSPTFELELYVENLSAQVLARFMPENLLLPAAGELQGTVHFVSLGGQLHCDGEVSFRQVRYRINEWVEPGRRDALEPALAEYYADTRVPVSCEGSYDDRGFRPLQTLVSRAHVAAAERAPVEIQQAVYEDQKRVEEDAAVPPALEAMLNRIEATTRAVRRVDETLRDVGETSQQVEETSRRFRFPKLRNPFR